MKQIDKLHKAIKMLTNKYDVIPEKYTMYNGAYLFVAYPKNVKDKDMCMNVHYLVDLKFKKVGPVSLAFDLDGFHNALKHTIDL